MPRSCSRNRDISSLYNCMFHTRSYSVRREDYILIMACPLYAAQNFWCSSIAGMQKSSPQGHINREQAEYRIEVMIQAVIFACFQKAKRNLATATKQHSTTFSQWFRIETIYSVQVTDFGHIWLKWFGIRLLANKNCLEWSFLPYVVAYVWAIFDE